MRIRIARLAQAVIVATTLVVVAGPSPHAQAAFDGEWVRVAPGDAAADRMQILVQGGAASIRYLPGAAPRGYRIGTVLWRNLQESGALEVMDGNGRYQPGQANVQPGGRLIVTGAAIPVPEVWVRLGAPPSPPPTGQLSPLPPTPSPSPPAAPAAATSGRASPAPSPSSQSTQWAAQPGETVRNLFGPSGSTCRGACGGACPSSCAAEVRYTCIDSSRLLRNRVYSCGTHLGCRVHDDCLDRCAQANRAGIDCDAVCHVEAVQAFGLENATAWLSGRGPFEGEPITFEYTRAAPGAPEPFYRCAEGTRQDCSGEAARCLAPDDAEVEPVFASFPAGPGGIGVAGFRSGPLCVGTPGGSRVCEEAVDIPVTGAESCAAGAGGTARCTRFGFELDYRGADPGRPLVCSTSSSDRQDDFLGSVVATGIKSMPSPSGGSDFGDLFGNIRQALRDGQSLTDVLSGISVTPLGPDGKPVAAASASANPAAPVPPAMPGRVALPAASGHLVVPMYALHEPVRSGEVVVREVTCSYNGVPVLETRYRLRYAAN